MANRTTRTPKKRKLFLGRLAQDGIVRAACEAAGIGRTTAYDWRSDDPAFKGDWDAAVDQAIDELERIALERAKGWTEIDDKGNTVKKHSDTLLIFLMKGARPEKYRDNAKVEHVGSGGGSIQLIIEK